MSEKAKRDSANILRNREFLFTLGVTVALLFAPFFVYMYLHYILVTEGDFNWTGFALQAWLFQHFLWIALIISIVGYICLIFFVQKAFPLGGLLGGLLQIMMLIGIFLLSPLSSIEFLATRQIAETRYELIETNYLATYVLKIATCQENHCRMYSLLYGDSGGLPDSHLDYDAATEEIIINLPYGAEIYSLRIQLENLETWKIMDYQTYIRGVLND